MNIAIPVFTHGITGVLAPGKGASGITLLGNALSLNINMADDNSTCQLAYMLQAPVYAYDSDETSKNYVELGVAQLTVRLRASSDSIFISQCQVYDGEAEVFNIENLKLSSDNDKWMDHQIDLPKWYDQFNYSIGILFTIKAGSGGVMAHQLKISSVGGFFTSPDAPGDS
jgi:hypothetical protein